MGTNEDAGRNDGGSASADSRDAVPRHHFLSLHPHLPHPHLSHPHLPHPHLLEGRASVAAPLVVVALAATGGAAYAGTLARSPMGSMGAGSASVPASCSASTSVRQGRARWDTDAADYVTDHLMITLSQPQACADSEFSVTICDESGRVLATGRRVLDGSPVPVRVHLDHPLHPAQLGAGASYSIVIQPT